MKKFAFSALALLLSAGSQAKVWNCAEVDLAGTPDIGGIYVKLNSITGDNTFNGKSFRLNANIENIGLAISMAALSSNRQVCVRSNLDEIDNAAMPVIDSIYLSKAFVTN